MKLRQISLLTIFLSAVIILLFTTGCPQPTGGDNGIHVHAWGNWSQGTEYKVTDWTLWEELVESFRADEPGNPTPGTAVPGIAVRYGTETTKRDKTHSCFCGATESQTDIISTREWDVVNNDDLRENWPIPPGQTVINGVWVEKGTQQEVPWSNWSEWAPYGEPSDWINGPNSGLGVLSSERYKTQQERRFRTKGPEIDEQFRTILYDKEAIMQTITLSSKDPLVADINTLGLIVGGNTNIEDLANGYAVATIRDNLLPRLSGQAKALQEFFAGSTGHAQFATLASNQSAIRNQVGSTTPQEYLGVVDAARGDALGFLGITGNADLQALFDGYEAGHYLITRDWTTAGNGAAHWDTGRYGLLQTAANVPGVTVSLNTAGYDSGRGTVISDAASNIAGSSGVLTAIENKLVDDITANLVLQNFPNSQKTKDMVRALIRQFGQDNVEFKAFIDDISTQSALTDAATRTYTATVASISPASSVKLASVAPDTRFPHDAVKGVEEPTVRALTCLGYFIDGSYKT